MDTDLSKTDMSMIFAFYEDGKGSLSTRQASVSNTEYFEYSYVETRLSITMEGETDSITAIITGDQMVMDFSPFLEDQEITKATLILKKVQ